MASDDENIPSTGGLTSHKGVKVRSYTIAFKLEAVAFATKFTNQAASVKYNVDRKTIREGRQKREDLIAMGTRPRAKKRQRLDGGGRKNMSDVLEERMVEWIDDRRSKKLHVSRKVLVIKAKVRTCQMLTNYICKKGDTHSTYSRFYGLFLPFPLVRSRTLLHHPPNAYVLFSK